MTRERVSAEQIFEDWARDQEKTRERLDEKSQAAYRSIWMNWIKWLSSAKGGSDRHWAAATTLLVERYLTHGIQPRGKDGRPVALTTRRRYWRVLQRIYEFARAWKYIKKNPAARAPEDAPSEKWSSTALPPPVWEELKKRPATPQGEHWTDLRDEVIMRLLVELALAPNEIILLTRSSRAPKAKPGSLRPDDKGRLRLHVVTSRGHGSRPLKLNPRLLKLLQAWEETRAQLAGSGASHDCLFLTTRMGPMTHRTLFHLVAGRIRKAYEVTRCGPAPAAHLGPMAIRTQRLFDKLEARTPAAEVAEFAGLKSEKHLMRLSRAFEDAARTRDAPKMDRSADEPEGSDRGPAVRST